MYPSHRPQTTNSQGELLSMAVSNVKLYDVTHISTSSLTSPELLPIASSHGDTTAGCAASVGYRSQFAGREVSW